MLPLRDASPADPLRGGYGFLEWSTYTGSWHEGVDLNCGTGIDGDLGVPLLALAPMTLLYSGETLRGFGKHQWWEVTDGPHRGAVCHYAHADSFVHSDVYTTVQRGDVIGTCGKTGGQYAAHLHWSVRLGIPPSWQYYGGGESKEVVASTHVDPLAFALRYDQWAEEGAFEMTDEERALIEAVRRTGYPAQEAAGLVDLFAGLHANAASVTGWINEIGALTASIDAHANDAPIPQSEEFVFQVLTLSAELGTTGIRDTLAKLVAQEYAALLGTPTDPVIPGHEVPAEATP